MKFEDSGFITWPDLWHEPSLRLWILRREKQVVSCVVEPLKLRSLTCIMLTVSVPASNNHAAQVTWDHGGPCLSCDNVSVEGSSSSPGGLAKVIYFPDASGKTVDLLKSYLSLPYCTRITPCYCKSVFTSSNANLKILWWANVHPEAIHTIQTHLLAPLHQCYKEGTVEQVSGAWGMPCELQSPRQSGYSPPGL